MGDLEQRVLLVSVLAVYAVMLAVVLWQLRNVFVGLGLLAAVTREVAPLVLAQQANRRPAADSGVESGEAANDGETEVREL